MNTPIKIQYRNLQKANVDEVEKSLERLDEKEMVFFKKRWEMAQRLREEEFVHFVELQEEFDDGLLFE
ncbi:MAG: hypothetical protein JW932_12045 [Deltaproteobacteria bacterium]|nr:hypothetical protein [Deltaproteobacteria bacterium]